MRRLPLAALIACAAACGPGPATSESSTTDPGTTTATTGDSGGTTTAAPTTTTATTIDPTGEASSTGAPALPCTCNLSDECPGRLNDCEAPAPCDRVDEVNPDATTCALELLVAQQFAQFSYCNLCGGFETYEGDFFILGPGQGIDLECQIFDFSQDLRVRHHTIEPPAYFEGCLALTEFIPRRDCLLAGFKPGDTLPLCEP